VYSKICEFTDIKVSNFTATGKADGAHIIVSTLGKLEKALQNRKKSIDVSALRCLVIDEADVFFTDERNLKSLQNLVTKELKKECKDPY